MFPKFVEENFGLRISLLYFDIDLYRPTLVGLQNLFPRVVWGGVVIFDEYRVPEWSGKSNAIEVYLAAQGYTKALTGATYWVAISSRNRKPAVRGLAA